MNLVAASHDPLFALIGGDLVSLFVYDYNDDV
jgi:hypothetical protein